MASAMLATVSLDMVEVMSAEDPRQFLIDLIIEKEAPSLGAKLVAAGAAAQ